MEFISTMKMKFLVLIALLLVTNISFAIEHIKYSPIEREVRGLIMEEFIVSAMNPSLNKNNGSCFYLNKTINTNQTLVIKEVTMRCASIKFEGQQKVSLLVLERWVKYCKSQDLTLGKCPEPK